MKEAEQRALIHSGSVIPTAIVSRYQGYNLMDSLHSAGVIFRGVLDDDSSLQAVDLPKGWEVTPSDDQILLSVLKDQQGRERGMISLDATVSPHTPKLFLATRFDVDYDFTKAKAGKATVLVRENGRVVYSPRPIVVPRSAGLLERQSIADRVFNSGFSWLDRQGYPEWKNPAAYWDTK